MTAPFKEYERFLRFERLESTIELMRGRAVYIIGLAFIFTQLLNIVFMTVSYGGWTLDHSISVICMLVTTATIIGLRYTKSFAFFTAVYTLFILIGVTASAVPYGTGIETALLPLLVAGCFVAGFIGGWFMAITYAIASISLVWGLYNFSYELAAMTPEMLQQNEVKYFQRAAQTTIAIILGTVFSVFVTNAMNEIFVKLERLLDQVKSSEKEKTEFLANLSHELRTPLNGMNGMCRLMNATPLNSDQRKYAMMMQRCSIRLSQIVVEALDLSKLDSGKFTLEEKPFNLKTTIVELIDKYEVAARKKNLELEMSYAPQLPVIFIGDQRRLRQVLKNLMVNALKFTTAGGVEIDVSGRVKGKDLVLLRIVVLDTGVGIAPENIDRIFERFQQVETSLSRKNTGTGLGLSLCRELVKYMGGQITVESEHGKGSQFIIDVPLRVAEQSNKRIETPGQMMQRASQRRAA